MVDPSEEGVDGEGADEESNADEKVSQLVRTMQGGFQGGLEPSLHGPDEERTDEKALLQEEISFEATHNEDGSLAWLGSSEDRHYVYL
jgi:hypothetical protein